MSAPEAVIRLVERFSEQYESYKATSYNETQVRREFIDPLFKALGWDIDNEEGLAEAYKDVVHEDVIRIGPSLKAPDYSMRIGGFRKFFLEAKKPSVDLKNDPVPAYQLRRYAWSAKLPLSILTDFEELAVYDCRARPAASDKASVARVLYFRFDEYISRWTEIASVISKEAILKGRFDKFLASSKLKRGTAEVDDSFLLDIESWRQSLAQNLTLHNTLSTRDLNYAVQQTIDRIIFLRICEDRGIEPYGRLQELQAGDRTYERLFRLFREADQRYNSGLFHFQQESGRLTPPDSCTPTLRLDDRVIKDILKSLYYPAPYEFSVLPVEVLGQVYERFLGRVVHVTPSRRVVVKEKPEVRKAGGVYYTPSYIVGYIVAKTVGELVRGKKPPHVAKLRVLDPACGSGSFLLGAYQLLLDWHLAWYSEHKPNVHARGKRPRLFRGERGEWRLTMAERKRILLANLFGVDIDPQAVEVTKLSLLLKVMEGESAETIGKNLALFRERALPDLDSNIKCGNSLIEQDFYQGKQANFLENEDLLRVNALDWRMAFLEIVRNGGFDAVIGNPPYVLLQDEFRDDEQLQYFRQRYTAASFKLDTYHLFIERGLSLAHNGGRFAMITPANFLTNNYLAGLRRLLLHQSNIDHILVIRGGVFQGVSVDNAIFVVTAGGPTTGTFPVRTVTGPTLQVISETSISAKRALGDEMALFTGDEDTGLLPLWKKISKVNVELGSIADVNFGKQLRDRKKFPGDVIVVDAKHRVPKGYVPCYTGRDVSRYRVIWNNLACLDDERARRGGCWDRAKHEATNKILTRQIGEHPEFALDTHGYHCLNTMFMINLREADLDPRWVLGVLNSRLLQAMWLDRFYDRRKTFPKIKGTYLKKLPIASPNRDIVASAELVRVVERIIRLQEQLAITLREHEALVLRRRMDALEQEADQIVFRLYGLSASDMAAVDSFLCKEASAS